MTWEFHFDRFHISKFPEAPEVVIGGWDSAIRDDEKARLRLAVEGGADGFQVSRFIARLIEKASMRHGSVGSRSVSILFPEDGMLDTDLWDARENALVAYMPRMIFPTGAQWGPSEFPIDLSLLLDGHLPKQSLFFKSIVTKRSKRSIRRRIFHRRSGPAIPGIMGILMLALFGEVPPGYSNFLAGTTDERATEEPPPSDSASD